MRIRLVAATILLTVASGAYAEASIDDVYRAASSGHVAEAQTMMQEVLKAHPDSAKAHFVEAELLVRQRNIEGARAELARATAINPSLSFAKPQSVQELRRALGEVGSARRLQEPASRGTPGWVWPVGFGLLIALAVWMFRSSRSRSAPTYGGMPSNTPGQPYPPYSPYGAQPSGGGSGLLGSLATGAVIGGGIVAGEALAHRLIDPDRPSREYDAPYADNPPDNDMGGNDFGVGDSGGWDDNGGGGGGDGGW